MAQLLINIGAAPNDGTGDTARAAGAKINANFTELYNIVNSGDIGGGGGFSGDYNDLTNKPTLGSAASQDYGTTAGKLVRLDVDAKLPAVDGSALLNLPTGLSDISSDTSPELGGNLTLGSYTVGDANNADLTKLHEVTATSTQLNFVDVSSSIQTQLNARVTKASYDANTILKADTSGSPSSLTVGENTIVGRIEGGNIAALSASDVRTIINVENGATGDMDGSEISSALLALESVDLAPLGNAILDSVAALPALATFQDWREGTSYSRLITPAFWKNLFGPAPVTYAATTVIDYTDNPLGGADIDTDRCRTLEPYITLTGNLTLAFDGITGSLVGRTIPVLLVNGGDSARTLTLTGTNNGITVSYAGGVTNPGIGSLTNNWLKVNVWFKSATEGVIVGFSRSA